MPSKPIGTTDHPMGSLSTERSRHQHAVPDHRTDPYQPNLDLQDLIDVRHRQCFDHFRLVRFRSCCKRADYRVTPKPHRSGCSPGRLAGLSLCAGGVDCRSIRWTGWSVNSRSIALFQLVALMPRSVTFDHGGPIKRQAARRRLSPFPAVDAPLTQGVESTSPASADALI